LRGASAGSFFTILHRHKLKLLLEKNYTDEHSGRILVDSVLAEEEKKMEQLFSKF
jgi:hypothetical protein